MENKNQFKGYGFLVTISQLPINKTQEELNTVISKLQDKEKGLNHKIIALSCSLEEHKDKGVHLHFSIAFKKRRFLESNYWNFLFDKQTNIQVITWNSKRSKSDAFAYAVKTDSVTYIDKGAQKIIDDAPRKYTGTDLDDYITKLIEEGVSLLDLQNHNLIEVRTYTRNHETNIIRAILRRETMEYELQQAKLPGLKVNLSGKCTPEHKTILRKFAQISKYKSLWPFRECAIIIVGAPQTYKSTCIRHLGNFVKIYNFPSSQWFTGYKNNFYELIVWDEPDFKTFTTSFLKKLFEGQELDLPIKGTMTSKKDRPLICLLSNHTIKELFKQAFLRAEEKSHCNNLSNSLCNCKDLSVCPIGKNSHDDFEAIYTRFTEVILKKDLKDLLKRFKKAPPNQDY